MTYLVFLRGVSDAGFYFFLAGIIAGLLGAQGWVIALGLLIECFALAAGYALRGKNARFAPLALPVLYILFMPGSFTERLAMAPFLIYVLGILRSEEYEPTWDHEADVFSKFWKVVLGFLFLWSSFGWMFKRGGDILNGTALPAALVTMTALVLLTRALRHDRDVYTERRRQMVDLAILAAVFLFAALLSSPPVLRGAYYCLRVVLSYLVWPVVKAALWLVSQVIKFTGDVLAHVVKGGSDVELPTMEESQGTEGETFVPGIMEKPGDGNTLLKVLIIGAAAAVLAYLAYRLLRMLFLRGPELADNGEGEIERVTIETAETSRPRGGARTPEERVRREYRRFLRLCRQRGVKLRPSDTSLSVERMSAQLSAPEEARELRRIYIDTRYGAITPEDAPRRAEEAYRRVKKLWTETKPPETQESVEQE